MIRSAEDILKENMPFGMLFTDVAIYAIKVAQREAIEASAEVAKVRIKEERLCQMPTGSQFKTTPVYIPFYEVDKQSILNLLNEVK